MRINATQFVADILTGTPVDTPIIYLAVIVNVSHFHELTRVTLDIIKNTLIENTFNFNGGGASADIVYSPVNPIDPAVNPTLVIERCIVYAQSIAVGTYTFDISVGVSGMLADMTPVFESTSSLGKVVVTGKSVLNLVEMSQSDLDL